VGGRWHAGILTLSHDIVSRLFMPVSTYLIPQSLIQAINQSTLLLHHLIFRTDPSLNLRHKLQHAPHRPFNSISHIFIVTFGRLSYCEAPSWLEGEMRQVLEYLAGKIVFNDIILVS